MKKRAASRKSIEGGLEKFFEDGFVKGYFFKVGLAFIDQLDIAQNSKGATMGTCFSFEAGDIFYDNAAAYDLPWGKALKKIGCFVRIQDALASSIIQEEITGGEKTPKKKYIVDGPLSFTLERKINGSFSFEKQQNFETNQYEFAQFLKHGILRDGEKTILDLTD